MFGLPVGLVAVLLVLLVAAIAVLALYLFRNSVKLEISEGHNEIAGFIFATVGVLYAVVLAFVVFAVWERFSAHSDAVSNEAALTVVAYRDTEVLPKAQRIQAQAAFRSYVHAVMDKEWASHGELLPHDKPDALNPIWALLGQAEQRPGADRESLSRAKDHLSEVELARHERHLSTESSLPAIFWVILLLGAFFTLAFAFIFDMGNIRVQALLTGLLAGLTAAMLFLVLSLERPFTGQVQVSKRPFDHALLVFDAIDLGSRADSGAKESAPEGAAAVIPASLFKGSCTIQNAPLQPGAVQTAVCTPPPAGCSGGKSCPDWEISIFPSAAALRSTYAGLRKANHIGSDFGKCNGTTWGGEGVWAHGPGKPGGRRFCYFDGNAAVMVWAHEKLGQASHLDMLGIARLGGSDHPRLYNWWSFWHHLIGKCQQADCVAELPSGSAFS